MAIPILKVLLVYEMINTLIKQLKKRKECDIYLSVDISIA